MSKLEALTRAKHDLGKYVAFQLRWLEADASDQDLLEALQADVLATRRGPSGTETALVIWDRLCPELQGLDIASIAAHVEVLRTHEAGLAAGTSSRAELEDCALAARGIAAGLAALHKSMREG